MMNESTPMIGMPPATLVALHRALAENRGAGEAAEIARKIGFSAGPAFHAALQDTLDHLGLGPARDLQPGTFWARLAEFFAAAGWGALEFEQSHPGLASLSSANWVEAAGRRANHPACHLTTGLLASLVTRVAGADLAILEAECRATGAERCSFLIGAPAALQTVYARIREGERYVDAVAALA